MVKEANEGDVGGDVLGYAHIRPQNAWPQFQEWIGEQKEAGHLLNTTIFHQVLNKLEDEMIELYGTTVPGNLLKYQHNLSNLTADFNF